MKISLPSAITPQRRRHRHDHRYAVDNSRIVAELGADASGLSEYVVGWREGRLSQAALALANAIETSPLRAYRTIKDAVARARTLTRERQSAFADMLSHVVRQVVAGTEG